MALDGQDALVLPKDAHSHAGKSKPGPKRSLASTAKQMGLLSQIVHGTGELDVEHRVRPVDVLLNIKLSAKVRLKTH